MQIRFSSAHSQQVNFGARRLRTMALWGAVAATALATRPTSQQPSNPTVPSPFRQPAVAYKKLQGTGKPAVANSPERDRFEAALKEAQALLKNRPELTPEQKERLKHANALRGQAEALELRKKLEARTTLTAQDILNWEDKVQDANMGISVYNTDKAKAKLEEVSFDLDCPNLTTFVTAKYVLSAEAGKNTNLSTRARYPHSLRVHFDTNRTLGLADDLYGKITAIPENAVILLNSKKPINVVEAKE